MKHCRGYTKIQKQYHFSLKILYKIEYLEERVTVHGIKHKATLVWSPYLCEKGEGFFFKSKCFLKKNRVFLVNCKSSRTILSYLGF